MFATRLVLAAVVLPPWQDPDEPVHFAVSRGLTHNAWLDIANRRNVDVQSEILQSMAAADWWKAYAEQVPEPLPATFAEVPTHLGDASNAPPLYYIALAAYSRALRLTGLLPQYFAARAASLALTLLTFAVILRAARAWFDDRVALLAGVFVALLPQFALIGIAVSPDPFIFLAGAVVWWQASRIAAGAALLGPIATMLLVTAAAVASKKLALSLLGELAALLFVLAVAHRRTRFVAIAAALGIVVLRGVGVLRAANFLPPERLDALHQYKLLFGWRGMEFSTAYFADFSWRLFESAYLVAGWQRFYAPPWITAAALVAIIVALSVTAVFLFRDDDRRTRLGAAIAAAVVAVQLASIYGTNYFRPEFGAQGRFLFPVIGAFACLCALGLARWRSPVRPWLCAVVVGALGLLDVMAWTTTVIPAYARWL